MSEVSSEAVEAWEKYRDGELWHRNRRQLRKRDYLAGYLAAHQPARVAPSAEEVARALFASRWPTLGWGRHSAHRRSAERDARAILALFASQPTVAEVREQVARDLLAAKRRNSGNDDPEVRRLLTYEYAARIARGETKGGE